jgi:hypothetical protein
LHDIIDLRVDEIQQDIDAPFRSALNLDCYLANRSYGPTHKVHINVQSVLLEFHKQLVDISLVADANHNVELLNFDVWWIIILAEENSQLLVEDIRLLLEEEVNVSERNVLDFRSGGNEGNCNCQRPLDILILFRLPRGGAIFLRYVFESSGPMFRMCKKTAFTAAITTAGFTCWNWGTTLSQMCSDSFTSAVL